MFFSVRQLGLQKIRRGAWDKVGDGPLQNLETACILCWVLVDTEGGAVRTFKGRPRHRFCPVLFALTQIPGVENPLSLILIFLSSSWSLRIAKSKRKCQYSRWHPHLIRKGVSSKFQQTATSPFTRLRHLLKKRLVTTAQSVTALTSSSLAPLPSTHHLRCLLHRSNTPEMRGSRLTLLSGSVFVQ